MTGSGGLTKFNHTQLELPKTHWLGAACGNETLTLEILATQLLSIKATGHSSRQMCRTNKFGFPSRHVSRLKFVKGFQTGDIVKAVVTSGKKIGIHVGRVAVRSTGSFNLLTAKGLIQGIQSQVLTTTHKKEGHTYSY